MIRYSQCGRKPNYVRTGAALSSDDSLVVQELESTEGGDRCRLYMTIRNNDYSLISRKCSDSALTTEDCPDRPLPLPFLIT
jgi:hypothetical protein